jgi:glycosyltransferase involved in cell wall biosynthesis
LDFWLQKSVIPRLDGNVVVSDEIARDFAPGKSYLRMEGGLPHEIEEKILAERTSRRSDMFTIVSAGSITAPNGIGLLLAAFDKLRGQPFRLRIAGRGPLDETVRAASETDPRIEHCGFLPFDRVLSLYAEADLLVSARITQQIDTRYFFPGKLMEYLGSGIPVITTCTGHVEEEFGTFVFLLRDETAESLAKLIQEVASLSPEDRDAIGRKARAYMLAEKTWDVQARRLTKYLYDLVAPHLSPAADLEN